MKISIISDVHVKKSGDRAEELLILFLRSRDVRESKMIFLLGDIFDLMIGPHSQYFYRFENFFTELKIILESGIKVCYVEGNHDFHLRKLFQKFFSVHRHIDNKLFEIADSFEIMSGDKKMYLSHGDDIELGNFNYKVFKAIVRSRPMQILAEHFIPHFLMKTIGEASSEKSRKINNKRYSNEFDLGPVKENFRKSVEKFHLKMKCQIYVLGHSHVQDFFQSENQFTYINNGYIQHSKNFIVVEDGNILFKSLDSFAG